VHKFGTVAGFLLAIIVAAVLPIFWLNPYVRLLSWGIVAVGALILASGITDGTVGFSRSLLCDSRNRFQQSNLISFAWLIVISSAYLSCALWNISLWKPDSGTTLPISIEVPASVWVLAGIVSTGLVGSSLILSHKLSLQGRLASTDSRPIASLKVIIRERPDQATISDLVALDEEETVPPIDLGALQVLLFQLAAVIVYIAALGRVLFMTPPNIAIAQFPVIPEGFLALLGISTATALANRAIPR
jgi:hypothetical protein